jgi:hypothetical protein
LAQQLRGGFARHLAEFVTIEIRVARREISAQRALTKLTRETNGNALLA